MQHVAHRRSDPGEPITNAREVVEHLHAGDTLVFTMPDQWRLARVDLAVSAALVPVLRLGGYALGPRFGGRLVPIEDGLPGILGGKSLAQTYRWKKDRSGAAIPR